MKITQNNELLKLQKTVGIVLKPNAKELKHIYPSIQKAFKKHNIDILIEKSSARMIDIQDGVDFDALSQKSDFLVSIGGDGTLISIARKSLKYRKAILGINLGTLGFLTSVLPDELDSFLDDFLNNKYKIDLRMMIKATINLNNSVAFNDIVIRSKSVSNMLNINAYIDNKKINSYYGDGLVISTPTGSTAYNLSSGGPVVYPLTDAFIVTPISAHSLTQRPLILPVDFELELSTPDNEGAIVIIDGQDIYEIAKNDKIKIKIASEKSRLIRTLNRDYFEVLNQKLNWGN